VSAGAAGRADDGAVLRAGIDVVCDGVSFDYDEGDRRVRALDGVGMRLAPGSATALLGPTGSGKSTLLQVLRGLLKPAEGVVTIDGALPESEGLERRRRDIGLVFQMPETQLFAATARDDVAFGPRQLGWTSPEVDDAVAWAMDAVRLPVDSYGARHPHSFSGGEQRRLAVAGVLAMRPRLLLLDEPFVSLDPASRRDLTAVLGSLHTAGMGFVLATHDIDLAWQLCPERIVLADGRVVAAGSWSFAAGGIRTLTENRLRPPFFVDLWRRLGMDLDEAPRSAEEAACALS
jgi:energy-coupling factor transporter ATP-binding protein EcfA2